MERTFRGKKVKSWPLEKIARQSKGLDKTHHDPTPHSAQSLGDARSFLVPTHAAAYAACALSPHRSMTSRISSLSLGANLDHYLGDSV